MPVVNENRAIRAKVWERQSAGFPVTVSFELTSDAVEVVEDLDDLERLRIDHRLRENEVVFHGKAWQQLHE